MTDDASTNTSTTNDTRTSPSPAPAADPIVLTAEDHRRRIEKAETKVVYAKLAWALERADLRIARKAAGLPEEDANDPDAAPRRLTIVGRLGDGGDGGDGGEGAGAAGTGTGGAGGATGWTPDRQRAFLGHLAECASVTHACRLVGLSKQSAYALRARAPRSVFAILWDVAVRQGRRRLYDEALERAMAGRAVAVWHRGEEVGTRQVHNDRLLMFLLAHEPPAVHPVLDDRQLAELWPALMAEVDAVLPPSAALARIADDVARDPNGNDRG